MYPTGGIKFDTHIYITCDHTEFVGGNDGILQAINENTRNKMDEKKTRK